MASEKKRKWGETGSTGKRRRHKGHDHDQLKILRLELHTIMEQIKILDREMEEDPCLSSKEVTTILSLVNGLKQDLEGTRLRIRELEGSTAA